METTYCPFCARENDPDSRYCEHCGNMQPQFYGPIEIHRQQLELVDSYLRQPRVEKRAEAAAALATLKNLTVADLALVLRCDERSAPGFLTAMATRFEHGDLLVVEPARRGLYA